MKTKKPGKPRLPLRAFDIPVIILSLALTFLIARSVYSGNQGPALVVIRGPDSNWIYPLDAGVEQAVAGPLGETRVLVHSGRAFIVSSPCRGQTCVAAGGLSRNGQWTACLPNMVFVLIEGAGGEVDAFTW